MWFVNSDYTLKPIRAIIYQYTSNDNSNIE